MARFYVLVLVETEAESITRASDAAEAPIATEMKRQPTRLPGIVSHRVIEAKEINR